jgi:hypothetical protein
MPINGPSDCPNERRNNAQKHTSAIAELLGKLQQPNFGTDDLLFSRHGGVLQSAEAGGFANPDRSAPRLGYRFAVGPRHHMSD